MNIPDAFGIKKQKKKTKIYMNQIHRNYREINHGGRYGDMPLKFIAIMLMIICGVISVILAGFCVANGGIKSDGMWFGIFAIILGAPLSIVLIVEALAIIVKWID